SGRSQQTLQVTPTLIHEPQRRATGEHHQRVASERQAEPAVNRGQAPSTTPASKQPAIPVVFLSTSKLSSLVRRCLHVYFDAQNKSHLYRCVCRERALPRRS